MSKEARHNVATFTQLIAVTHEIARAGRREHLRAQSDLWWCGLSNPHFR